MSAVTVTVRGNVYEVACEEGQEIRLDSLANALNKRIAKFATAFPQASDPLIAIMVALTIEDELSDLKRLHQQLSLDVSSENKSGNVSDDMLSETLCAIAEYVENLANKVKSC